LAFRVEIDIRGVADPKVLTTIPAGEQSVSDRLIQALEDNTSVKVLHLNGEILCCFQLVLWKDKMLLRSNYMGRLYKKLSRSIRKYYIIL
jgi:hypothetical protein